MSKSNFEYGCRLAGKIEVSPDHRAPSLSLTSLVMIWHQDLSAEGMKKVYTFFVESPTNKLTLVTKLGLFV